MNTKIKKLFLLLLACLAIFIIFTIYIIIHGQSYSNNPTKVIIQPEDSVNKTIEPKNSDILIQGMTETFYDDFSSFNRYTDKNGGITCNPGGIGIWQTIYHFCERTSSANKEAEIYLDPGFLSTLKNQSLIQSETDSDNPFSISNGILKIKIAPSNALIKSTVGRWAKYTSGIMTTQFSFSQKYGYFEMRAKLPKGKGIWPAFWLLPVDGTWPPEIDIMEAFGGPNPTNEGGLTKMHYASHSLVAEESCGKWVDTTVDLSTDFHTYGANIQPTGITYYFDGLAYKKCKANSDTNKPFFIIINVAVGGPGSWPGEPDASNIWPAVMEVDYVKVLQTKESH